MFSVQVTPPPSNSCCIPPIRTGSTPAPSLLQPESAPVDQRTVMMGVGFGPQGVPIDIATAVLAAPDAKQRLFLITDSFGLLNGTPPAAVESNAERLQVALARLLDLYGISGRIERCSAHMSTTEYLRAFSDCQAVLEALHLQDLILNTVPERFRHLPHARTYPVHELAMTLYLSRAEGVQVKLGPGSERPYDQIMQRADFPVTFAYLVDALPIATRYPSAVVHYIPGHRAKGTRLMLHSPSTQAAVLLEQSHEDTLRYLLRLASAGGRCLWQAVLF